MGRQVGITCAVAREAYSTMTNAQSIRSMSDEELARELWRIWLEFETEKIICSNRNCDDVETVFDEKCLQCIFDWLRQPKGGTPCG